MPSSSPLTLLCITSEVKGFAFIREAKRQGCRVLVLTLERFRDDEWPRESIDDMFFMPDLFNVPHVVNAVSYLARSHRIDQVVPLDDFEVETAAHLREHMRLPGMGLSLAKHFRDKLAMRSVAQAAGVRVPPFTGVFHYDTLREFMARVPPPWLLKPRSEASAMGIKKLQQASELWPLLDSLGDRQSHYVLEQFVPGEVFHVDGLVWEGELLFTAPHQYGRPPMDVYHGGGVFYTRTMDWEAPETRALLDFNRQLLKALGMVRGATHAEYIRAHGDGHYYFLECAARVGGANIAETVEYATGLNLWAEWAKMEICFLRGEPYHLPETRAGYAAVLNCLARQQWPDLSGYNDSEVVWRLKKEHHAGLIVTTPDAARLQALLDSYSQRFARDFLAVAPPLESGAQL
jgi:biotin carboxylase